MHILTVIIPLTVQHIITKLPSRNVAKIFLVTITFSILCVPSVHKLYQLFFMQNVFKYLLQWKLCFFMLVHVCFITLKIKTINKKVLFHKYFRQLKSNTKCIGCN